MLLSALVLAAGCRLSKGAVRVGDGEGEGEPGGASGARADGAGDRRTELTLDNGLRVVLEESHASPVVAMQAWVGVGSADDPASQAGVAHLFEHLLFKGTGGARPRGVGEIAREVEAAGGDINAWTSFDESVYHLVLASRYFDTGLDILADALCSPTFDPAELERERKVVLEEVKQAEDAPDRVASQLLFATTWRAHPYGRSILGSEATVASLTRDQVLAFYRRHYVARNVTLVIVGDFDAVRAKGKIAAAFAAMRRGEPPAARPAEPPQTAPRTAILAATRDAHQAQLLMAFRAPAIAHEDVAALDLLAVMLGDGETSRLNVQLTRNRPLATGARAYTFASRDGGMLVVGASTSPARVEEASRAILDEVLRLARQEVPRDELARARATLEGSIVRDKETVEGCARKLGYYASVGGDAALEAGYLGRVRGLTPGELQAVAARYLRVSNLTTAVLVPEAAAAASGSREGGATARLTSRLEAVAAAAEARADHRAAAAPAAASGSPAAVDGVVRAVLPSGLRVVVLPDGSVPLVSLQAIWPGGLRYEDARSNGVSNLLAAVLPHGRRGSSSETIAGEVADLSGEISGFAGRNSLGLRAEVLSTHWERVLELLADCIRNPKIADADLERERRVVLEDIRAREDDAGLAAFRLFQSTLWKKHPYRMEVLGSAESLSSLTRRKLVEHYRRYYPLSALTIAVVGDVDAGRVLTKVQALFGDQPGSPSPSPSSAAVAVAAEPARDQPAEVFQVLRREQAHVVLGYPGTTLQDADRFALEVLSQILSGQGGRLFVELREKRALAYQVSASSVEGIDPGYFAVYLACSPPNLEQGVLAIRAQLARVAADGVTGEEVARARKHLVGAHAIALQRRSALAGALALGEAYGQGWRAYRRYGDEIEKVTPDEVRRVARKYLDTTKEVVAVVKPEEPARRAAGVVESRPRAAGVVESRPRAAGALGAKTPAVGRAAAAP